MPRRPQFPEECAHCGRLADHLIKGRCGTCYSYWRKHDHRERPLRVWRRAVAGTWEEVGPGEAVEPCDCGGVATARLVLPVAEKGRMVLFLCEDCAELERALSPSSSWAD